MIMLMVARAIFFVFQLGFVLLREIYLILLDHLLHPRKILKHIVVSLAIKHSISSISSLIWSTPSHSFSHEKVDKGSVYNSQEDFRENYKQMENLKIYAYPMDNDQYNVTSLEGYFSQHMRSSSFITSDPNSADLFFVPPSMDWDDMMTKYPYWMPTWGTDHFHVICQDGELEVPLPILKHYAIRLSCSPVQFNPTRDVLLPHSSLPYRWPHWKSDIEDKKLLGFWAGNKSSRLGEKLVDMWGADKDLYIRGLDAHTSYGALDFWDKLHNSKFCICPAEHFGVSVARITEAIYFGCVPVIFANEYELPFNNILDWSKFSVILKEECEFHELKHILKSKGKVEFELLYYNLLKVQKHFRWNTPPIEEDAFHMVVYELWLRSQALKKWRNK
ncbi:probable glycosyltransferase At3g07620 [Nicotiana sylvestris]|uniref:Probable glycosyltransferase At3g07620 n=1 Tax=Nicotiana sylvestris TaxID=4096 RepID=A0A1U7W906_NICSY|nr:PREDICTED: probable glycosyltransferase At3g07620 [Nicotiana sylvestris]